MDLNQPIRPIPPIPPMSNNIVKPFHSSGIAEVANANHLGATSEVTFDQRKQVMRNRLDMISNQRLSTGGEIRITPVARPVTGRFIMPQRTSLRQQQISNQANRTFNR